jgi:hypothetical protein
MRRNPATVVVLAGRASDPLLGAVSGSMNVALIRPEDPGGGLESAAAALRRAAGIYLVLAEETAPGTPGEQRPDFYLGPLRSVRPHRVAVVAAAEPAGQAAGVLSALGSLRHGRWWPSFEEIIGTARGFYPGALAGSPDAGQSRLLA